MAKEAKGKSLLFWLGRRHKRRRRKGDQDTGPRALSDVLRKLEPQAFEQQRQRCAVSHATWEEVAGVRISDRTTPRRLDADGTLVVGVSSSVWAQELSFLSETLCERLRARGHRVQALRFMVGVIEAPRRGTERFETKHVPAPAPIDGTLARELEAIDDEELRRLIRSTAAASLAASDKDRKGR